MGAHLCGSGGRTQAGPDQQQPHAARALPRRQQLHHTQVRPTSDVLVARKGCAKLAQCLQGQHNSTHSMMALIRSLLMQ